MSPARALAPRRRLDTPLVLLTAVLAAMLTGCTTPAPAPRTAAPPLPAGKAALEGFCARAQSLIVGTQVPSTAVVHDDYDTFVKSKPVVRPLQVQQYHWPAPPDGSPARMISCKMKTADHIVAEYGEATAGADAGCAAVNRDTLQRVVAGMTAAERRRLRFDADTVVHDAEERTTNGPIWLEPHAVAYVGADGRLHLRTKAMRNDWLDPRYRDAPPQFKGTRYCHFVAPDHLRRLLLGETPPQ
jgi:hypothetical protein